MARSSRSRGTRRAGTARSAISGRLVRAATARRYPRTTVVATTGRRGTARTGRIAYRSAITGKFVSAATASRHPRTTVAEHH